MSDLLDQQWSVSNDAPESRVGDETVLLHLGSGTYFGLDATGTRVWNALKSAQSPRSICASIAADTGESATQVEADVRAFLEQLARHALIERA